MEIHTLKKCAILSTAVAAIAVLLIYLTPLKWVNLVEPKIKDVLPTLFYNEYRKNPRQYIFIDVRPPEAYNQKHAEGSINIPLHLLYDERKNLPKTGKVIVLICSGGRASGVAYHYLEHFGFLNLLRISGGIEAWEAVGLPIVAQTGGGANSK